MMASLRGGRREVGIKLTLGFFMTHVFVKLKKNIENPITLLSWGGVGRKP